MEENYITIFDLKELITRYIHKSSILEVFTIEGEYRLKIDNIPFNFVPVIYAISKEDYKRVKKVLEERIDFYYINEFMEISKANNYSASENEIKKYKKSGNYFTNKEQAKEVLNKIKNIITETKENIVIETLKNEKISFKLTDISDIALSRLYGYYVIIKDKVYYISEKDYKNIISILEENLKNKDKE